MVCLREPTCSARWRVGGEKLHSECGARTASCGSPRESSGGRSLYLSARWVAGAIARCLVQSSRWSCARVGRRAESGSCGGRSEATDDIPSSETVRPDLSTATDRRAGLPSRSSRAAFRRAIRAAASGSSPCAARRAFAASYSRNPACFQSSNPAGGAAAAARVAWRTSTREEEDSETTTGSVIGAERGLITISSAEICRTPRQVGRGGQGWCMPPPPARGASRPRLPGRGETSIPGGLAANGGRRAGAGEREPDHMLWRGLGVAIIEKASPSVFICFYLVLAVAGAPGAAPRTAAIAPCAGPSLHPTSAAFQILSALVRAGWVLPS